MFFSYSICLKPDKALEIFSYKFIENKPNYLLCIQHLFYVGLIDGLLT